MESGKQNTIPFVVPSITQFEIVQFLVIREMLARRERHLRALLMRGVPIEDGSHSVSLISNSLIAE